MRLALAAIALLIAGSVMDGAKADPYRWCAQYTGRPGGTNCYFITLQQCQATVSGIGGYCRPNPFYTGEAPQRRSRRHS